MSLRTVGVRLTADVSQYVANMHRAGQSTKGFAQQLDKQAAAGKLDAVADSAGIAGIALGGAAAYATKQFMDFDKQMSAVKAATHGSAAEMDQLAARRRVAGQLAQLVGAVGDEGCRQRAVAVQRSGRPALLDELEGHLCAARDLLGELPGGLLDEGGEGVVQRAVVHARRVRRGYATSSRAHAGLQS